LNFEASLTTTTTIKSATEYHWSVTYDSTSRSSTYYMTVFTNCRELGHHQAEDWALWKSKNAELISKAITLQHMGKKQPDSK
jgi:hypothetical protein